MKVLTKVFYLFVSILFSFLGISQTIPDKGVPKIYNYLPTEYALDEKAWEIKIAPNGKTYFATDEGLMEFDGKYWTIHKGSKGITRSLYIENDSVIYTGSDLDFGVFRKKDHSFEYESLFPFSKDIPEEKEEFWKVGKCGNTIVYVSSSNLYCFIDHQITKIRAPHKFTHSFFSKDNSLFLVDSKEGIFQFNGKSLVNITSLQPQLYSQIIAIEKINNTLLVVTESSGVWLYNTENKSFKEIKTPISDLLKKEKVFSFTALNNDYWCFGTILNGVYITDTSGTVFQHINKEKGLPHNTILNLCSTEDYNLWISMDYGISQIPLASQQTYFYDYNGIFGTPQVASLLDGSFYLGSNQGLYKKRWEYLNNFYNTNFELIKGSEGQVWNLKTIDNQLLCCHNEGLFWVNNNSLTTIYNQDGVQDVTAFRKDFLITGDYNGVSILKKENDTFQFIKKLDSIYGSCSQVINQNDILLWINIPNYGIVKVSLGKTLNIASKAIFLTEKFKSKKLKIKHSNGKIFVQTKTTLYQFNEHTQQFEVSSNKALSDLNSYTTDELSKEYSFSPIQNGFVLIKNQPTVDFTFQYPLIFSQNFAYNNTTKINVYPNQDVTYKLNNFKFNFSLPQAHDAVYQYRLLPLDDNWTTATANNEALFLNLKEGNYNLEVKAFRGGSVTQNTFQFSVLSPWYRSFWAYIGYFLAFIFVVYLIRQRQKQKLKKQKFELLKKEQNSLRQQAVKFEQQNMEQKQLQLENEKRILSEQLREKTIELAKQAKENEDNDRALQKIKEKLKEIQHTSQGNEAQWKEVYKMLAPHINNGEQTTFEIQIDALHQEFFSKMKEHHPELSLYDLRLCAYLKLGFNSKEIADMLHVLPSSINVSRSRLRKKLNLEQNEDLFDFLNQY